MLSKDERDRLVGLFPPDTVLPAENMAALMINNTPAVARKWLEQEGLLDEQIAQATP